MTENAADPVDYEQIDRLCRKWLDDNPEISDLFEAFLAGWLQCRSASAFAAAHDYDRDPEALAWARAIVQRDIDRFRRFESKARSEGRDEQASFWRKIANFLNMDFIGGEGCKIAAFDERRPSLPAVDDGGPW